MRIQRSRVRLSRLVAGVRVLFITIGMGSCALTSASALATLIDRGHGLIYDSALDVTWLQNANPFTRRSDKTPVTAESRPVAA